MPKNQNYSLAGKVAVVTGGASGIGLETVQRFLQSGAKVVIADLANSSGLSLELGCVGVEVDVRDLQQMQMLMRTAVDAYGNIDILVTNAGVFADYKSLMDSTVQDFQHCFDINLMGIVNGIQAAVPFMSNPGSIINTASLAGKMGVVDLSSYTASKHAAVGVTQSAALELADRGIRVNCVCPSTVNTPMAHAEGGEDLVNFEKNWNPMGRICEPAEVAALIHFLAAEDCGFINGQAINLCGGATAGLHQRSIDALTRFETGNHS